MRNVLFRPPLAPPWITLSDSDARAYIKSVEMADGQSLPVPAKRAIYLFIAGCKADGIWSQIKSACILCGASTLSGALTPLVGTAPTNFNFVSADYDRRIGLMGNGSTKYLDSNRNNNADPQDNNHNAVFLSVSPTIGLSLMGAGAADPGANNILSGATRNRNSVALSLPSTTTGFIGASRSASASYTQRAGSATATQVQGSQMPFAGNLFLFARNTGTPNLYSNPRLAFYSIGEALDLALLDARVTALINAIQAAIT